MTTDYRGLDYLPEMVEICKRRHPNARIELGDARYLAGYPDAYFGLVNFSFNGLDAVSHGDRILVLKSVRRVLAPGGMFHFSTLNIDGPGFGERPWRIQVGRTRNPLRYAFRALDAALAIPVSIWNWAQLRRSEQRGPGYAVAPISAHRFGVLVHFTSLKRQMDELADAGFSGDVVVFENDTGERIPAEVGATTAHWFEVVARSPG
jgi:SAM-dependent methyltransferase